MPSLKKHFEELEVPKEIWVAKRFQTLYTITMPVNAVIRIWDCLLVYGIEFIINFTLALVKSFEDDLIKLHDTIDVVEYFKAMSVKETKVVLNFNIEDIISKAKKISLDKETTYNITKKYERENDVLVSDTYIKYELDVNIIINSYFDQSLNLIKSDDIINSNLTSRIGSTKCCTKIEEDNSFISEKMMKLKIFRIK
jgi:hypothetical protein